MSSPTFLRSTAQLEKWREQFNPLRGLTMRRLSSLLEEADRGLYANVMWLLRKVERRDEVVRACKARMLSELARLEWMVSFPSDPPADVSQSQIDAQVTWLKQRYDALENLKAALQFLALADLRGFAHCEKHYGKDGYPHRLECVPQWHWQKPGFYGQWKFDEKATGVEALNGVPIEAEHFIIREVDDPWFEIALIKAQRKSLGDKDFDAFVESYGIPWVFFIGPPGADATKIAEFQAIADEIAGDGRGVLPNGSDVKGPPGSASSNAAVFKQYLDRQDSAIVLAATGGLLTVLTAPGSGTLAGSSHQEAWENVVAGVAKNVSECLQEQFDKPLLTEQFPGQPVLAWFELAYPDQPEARGEFAKDIKMLKDAGYAVKREVVSEKTGLELEEETKDEGGGMKDEVPAEPPEPPVKNRDGSQSADALQLAEKAVANVLQVGAGYLAPLRAPLARLTALAESDTATLADFEALAKEISDTFPELLDELDVASLASELEAAMGSAAAMGARDAIRARAKAEGGRRKAEVPVRNAVSAGLWQPPGGRPPPPPSGELEDVEALFFDLLDAADEGDAETIQDLLVEIDQALLAAGPPLRNWSPSQPRDEQGQWATGGGGGQVKNEMTQRLGVRPLSQQIAGMGVTEMRQLSLDHLGTTMPRIRDKEVLRASLQRWAAAHEHLGAAMVRLRDRHDERRKMLRERIEKEKEKLVDTHGALRQAMGLESVYGNAYNAAVASGDHVHARAILPVLHRAATDVQALAHDMDRAVMSSSGLGVKAAMRELGMMPQTTRAKNLRRLSPVAPSDNRNAGLFAEVATNRAGTPVTRDSLESLDEELMDAAEAGDLSSVP